MVRVKNAEEEKTNVTYYLRRTRVKEDRISKRYLKEKINRRVFPKFFAIDGRLFENV